MVARQSATDGVACECFRRRTEASANTGDERAPERRRTRRLRRLDGASEAHLGRQPTGRLACRRVSRPIGSGASFVGGQWNPRRSCRRVRRPARTVRSGLVRQCHRRLAQAGLPRPEELGGPEHERQRAVGVAARRPHRACELPHAHRFARESRRPVRFRLATRKDREREPQGGRFGTNPGHDGFRCSDAFRDQAGLDGKRRRRRIGERPRELGHGRSRDRSVGSVGGQQRGVGGGAGGRHGGCAVRVGQHLRLGAAVRRHPGPGLRRRFHAHESPARDCRLDSSGDSCARGMPANPTRPS